MCVSTYDCVCVCMYVCVCVCVHARACANTYIVVHECRVGSGAPAGTVWAGPLFEFLTLLIAINYYKTTYLPKSLNRNSPL